MSDPIKSPLAKVYDSVNTRERDQAADDVMDIVLTDIQGRTEVGDNSRIENESDARAERMFFEAVAAAIGERCKEWMPRYAKVKLNYDGHGTGYQLEIPDREGRRFTAHVTYSEMSAVAELQRKADTIVSAMADRVCEKINSARAVYFERMRAATVGIG